MANIVCPLCDTPPFSTLRKLLRHIRLTHADSEAFNVQCTLQGCRRTFRSFNAYRIHIYRRHQSSQPLALDVPSAPVQDGEYIEPDPTEDESDCYGLDRSELNSDCGKNIVRAVIILQLLLWCNFYRTS